MLTIASLFAGVGGIDLGFEKTGRFKTVYANEFDRYALETYSINFPNVTTDNRDIHEVPVNEIPTVDVIVGGFPCQAFSIAGLQQGFDDEKGRGDLFFEMIRIVQAKKPRFVLFENVKNLKTHDEGRTYSTIIQTLDSIGYFHTDRILNACEYGNIPQNRERIYILAVKNEYDYNSFEWPNPVLLTLTVKDIIDFNTQVDEKYYYTPGKFKGDIYDKLVEAMSDDDPSNPGIYQWRRTYVRKNQKNLVPTLTANQGGGGHNVCLIKTKYGIRKMTPRECFNAQGFPSSFKLPENQSDARLYKQAGNSVCVSVIQNIAEQLSLL